jgi:hypothetical protein
LQLQVRHLKRRLAGAQLALAPVLLHAPIRPAKAEGATPQPENNQYDDNGESNRQGVGMVKDEEREERRQCRAHQKESAEYSDAQARIGPLALYQRLRQRNFLRCGSGWIMFGRVSHWRPSYMLQIILSFIVSDEWGTLIEENGRTPNGVIDYHTVEVKMCMHIHARIQG